ncbi:MAG: S26 family signal peptidase, partial [Candidatus Micrarchaeota archaeon]|nr:S26 family signal peptidase [Candidatus Micrarchaeota archaeon]
MRAKQQNQKDEVKHPKEGTPPSIWVLYALIALSVIVYALYGNAIFGALAFVLIVVTLVAEFRGSVKQGGMKNSVYEIVTALVGVAVLWLILSIVLSTTSPLNVVASCSMLPSMHRGDLVILHGISNMSLFLQSKHVPTVNVSPDVLSSTFSNMNSEFLAYYFYSPSNPSDL